MIGYTQNEMDKYGVSPEAWQILVMLAKQNELSTQQGLVYNQNYPYSNYSFLQNNYFTMGNLNLVQNPITQPLIRNSVQNMLNSNPYSNLTFTNDYNKITKEKRQDKKSCSEEKNSTCSELKNTYMREDQTCLEKVGELSIYFLLRTFC